MKDRNKCCLCRKEATCYISDEGYYPFCWACAPDKEVYDIYDIKTNKNQRTGEDYMIEKSREINLTNSGDYLEAYYDPDTELGEDEYEEALEYGYVF